MVPGTTAVCRGRAIGALILAASIGFSSMAVAQAPTTVSIPNLTPSIPNPSPAPSASPEECLGDREFTLHRCTAAELAKRHAEDISTRGNDNSIGDGNAESAHPPADSESSSVTSASQATPGAQATELSALEAGASPPASGVSLPFVLLIAAAAFVLGVFFRRKR